MDLNDPLRLRRDLWVMRHDNHRVPLIAQLMQDRHDLFTRMAVERAGRFIREDHLSTVHERTGNTDSLLLTAGKLRRLIFHPFCQPQTR